jgi:tetratricopeptide (TPR) repeat protein
MTEDVARMSKAAVEAIARGDVKGAHSALLEALQRDRANTGLWLNLAAVRRHLNDFEGAFAALREALLLDNRNFAALLMQATLLDRLGQGVAAAHAYEIALVQAPPDDKLDAATRQAVARARAVHQKHIDDLGRFIRERTAPACDPCTPAVRRRIESFIDTTLRTRKRYQQEPTDYYYPGLPRIEFYEREEFPAASRGSDRGRAGGTRPDPRRRRGGVRALHSLRGPPAARSVA